MKNEKLRETSFFFASDSFLVVNCFHNHNILYPPCKKHDNQLNYSDISVFEIHHITKTKGIEALKSAFLFLFLV